MKQLHMESATGDCMGLPDDPDGTRVIFGVMHSLVVNITSDKGAHSVYTQYASAYEIPIRSLKKKTCR